MSLLSIQNLVKRFGALTATDHVSLEVEKGEIHALIGPNGAGKSTLVHLISGLLPADGGSLKLDGQELIHLAPTSAWRLACRAAFKLRAFFRS